MGVIIPFDRIRTQAERRPQCLRCGSRNTEVHGTGAGDFIWFLCRDCGANWPVQEEENHE